MASDILHAPDTHNMSKTCITWTQNVIRNCKAKTKGAKGRLEEKTAEVFFVLTAFNFFGQFNIFGLM
jgi:hypothetical protein